MFNSRNSAVIRIRFSIVLQTASLSVMLSVASLPVVSPGIITACPVTNYSDEYPSLFTEVLCVHAAAFTSESVCSILCSSISFLIVMSVLAWFLSLMPLDHGE